MGVQSLGWEDLLEKGMANSLTTYLLTPSLDWTGESFTSRVRIASKLCVSPNFTCHGETLCDSMDCSPPGSSVHGILQTRSLEWVAMPSSRGSSRPRD